MVFKSMFPPKGKIVLQARDNSVPGAKLPVEIMITVGEEIQPREVRAELLGIETYYVKEIRHSSKGNTTHIVKKNNTFTKITQIAAEQPVLAKGMEQKWSISLQIPPNAHPTCLGKIVNVQWTLKALMDVPNRLDMVQEIPFRMFCPPPQPGAVSSAEAQQAYDDATRKTLQDVSDRLEMLQKDIPFRIFSPPPEQGNISAADSEQVYDDITVNLNIPGQAKTGETMLGQLTLNIKDRVNVRGIRLELVQSEDAGVRKGDTVITKTAVSGSASFNPGESPSFEFFIPVPTELQPTTISNLGRLRWIVRAVLDRPMKKDFNVEKEVYIYNAPEQKQKIQS